jgi:hypothetical protein
MGSIPVEVTTKALSFSKRLIWRLVVPFDSRRGHNYGETKNQNRLNRMIKRFWFLVK